jgi:hypothetical protein
MSAIRVGPEKIASAPAVQEMGEFSFGGSQVATVSLGRQYNGPYTVLVSTNGVGVGSIAPSPEVFAITNRGRDSFSVRCSCKTNSTIAYVVVQ